MATGSLDRVYKNKKLKERSHAPPIRVLQRKPKAILALSTLDFQDAVSRRIHIFGGSLAVLLRSKSTLKL